VAKNKYGNNKLRLRSGYQIFSAKLWFRVKARMSGGASFSEISREIGNQVEISAHQQHVRYCRRPLEDDFPSVS